MGEIYLGNIIRVHVADLSVFTRHAHLQPHYRLKSGELENASHLKINKHFQSFKA